MNRLNANLLVCDCSMTSHIIDQDLAIRKTILVHLLEEDKKIGPFPLVFTVTDVL